MFDRGEEKPALSRTGSSGEHKLLRDSVSLNSQEGRNIQVINIFLA